MARPCEWELQLYKDDRGELYAALYEVPEDGQLSWVADEAFGPFDTATDVANWLVRHWGPRAKFPLR